MTFVEDVQNARSPREAMLNLAAGLDVLVERIDKLESSTNWDSWGDSVEQRLPQPVQITEQDGETEVVIPPPSTEKMAKRMLFEQQALHLSEYLHDDDQDWTEVYAKGGPMWLYIGNPELVKSLPDGTRRALVSDLEEDSPQQAREMARDILKEPADATGYGNAPALADEFAGGVSGIRGTG